MKISGRRSYYNLPNRSHVLSNTITPLRHEDTENRKRNIKFETLLFLCIAVMFLPDAAGVWRFPWRNTTLKIFDR